MTSERKFIHRRGLLGGAITALAALGALYRGRRGRGPAAAAIAANASIGDGEATPAATAGPHPRRKPPIWIGHL